MESWEYPYTAYWLARLLFCYCFQLCLFWGEKAYEDGEAYNLKSNVQQVERRPRGKPKHY